MIVDREALREAGGVAFRNSDYADMKLAAEHYWRVEHMEHAEGAFFNGAEVHKRLKRIADRAEWLHSELIREDVDGHAAAALSGGEFHIEAIERLRDRARAQAERAKQANELERGQSSPETTSARKALVRIVARCWYDAGGEGAGDKINSWADREEYGPLILLIRELARQSGAPEIPSAKTIQRDLRELSDYADRAEVFIPRAPRYVK